MITCCQPCHKSIPYIFLSVFSFLWMQQMFFNHHRMSKGWKWTCLYDYMVNSQCVVLHTCFHLYQKTMYTLLNNTVANRECFQRSWSEYNMFKLCSGKPSHPRMLPLNYFPIKPIMISLHFQATASPFHNISKSASTNVLPAGRKNAKHCVVSYEKSSDKHS